MDNNIKIRIEFWIDLWEDLISNFLKKSYGLSLYSPHILVEDIITEIEENSFKNSDNKKYFYSKLSYYFENDLIIKQEFNSSFKILRSIFHSNRVNYILETAKKIKDEFQKGLYFDSCLDFLAKELLKDEDISLEFIYSINYLSQNIIVELIKKGYDLEDIKKFAANIFDFYKTQNIENDDILSTNFPHDINFSNYKDEKDVFDRTKYNNDIIEVLTNLNEEQRIKTLSYYFYKKKEKAHYIFIVKGLKGSIDIQIGSTTFYSLDKKQFLSEENNQHHREDLQKDITGVNTEKFIQAAVEMDYLLPKSSLTNALIKLENSVDLISCYFNTKTEIEINTSNYIIAQDGRNIYSSWSRDKRDNFTKYHESLDLNEYEKYLIDLNEYSFLWNDTDLNRKSKSKILNAIHWYSKAELSVKQEDKMLNYWIAIENLFNLEFDIKTDILDNPKKGKIHLIQEIISSVQIFRFIYDYGWEIYRHYSNEVINLYGKPYKLTDELIQKANLNPKVGESIHLERFIECLPEIKNYEKDLFILKKVDDVINFYNDPKITKRNIEEQIKLIENDLLMIYRFRNLIVHNAHFDNALLPYFVWKIKEYSGSLIRNLISEYKKNDIELSNLMINMYLKKEKFLFDLESGKVNLFSK